MIKTCIICNKQFEPNHHNIKFCSENCRKRYYNEYQKRYQKNHIKYITKICIICDKEFETHKPKQKWCSEECKEKRKERTFRIEYIKNCIICGKEFKANHRNIKFCSENCRQISKKEKNDKYQKKYKEKHKKEYNIKRCVICNKDFNPRLPNQKTCSIECRKEYMNIYIKEYKYKKPSDKIKNIILKKESIKIIIAKYFEKGNYNINYIAFYNSILQIIPDLKKQFLSYFLRKEGFKIIGFTLIGLRYNKEGLEKFKIENLSQNINKENITSAKACKLLSCDIGREKIKEYYDNLNENDKKLIDLEKTLEKYKEIEKRLYKINKFRSWKSKASLALYLANSKLITQVDACKIGKIDSLSLRSLLDLLKRKRIKIL